ncbi:type II toxin-antitoxin system HicB family antitoxin [Candidatus Poribacteria bacterium]
MFINVKATGDIIYTERTFVAHVEWDPESDLYVGIVQEVPGAHTQGATLDELHDNLKEVLELCLEEYEGRIKEL